MTKRHHLIFAAPDSAYTIHSIHADHQQILAYVADWIHQGLPLIYTRQSTNNDLILKLGLPIVKNGKKYKIGVSLNRTDVQKQEELPSLMTLIPFLAAKLHCNSMTWCTELRQLKYQSIAVYGSYLFEYLSNQPFVQSNSDLDLLIHYENESVTELKQKISRLFDLFKIPVDGEIRFKNLGDIALKEIMNSEASQFLFKNRDAIGLITRTDLYQQFPGLYEQS